MGVSLGCCCGKGVEQEGQVSELPANLFYSTHLRSWIQAAGVIILNRVAVLRLGMGWDAHKAGDLGADDRKQLLRHCCLWCLPGVLGVFLWRDFGLSPLTCCKNKSASTESSKTKGWLLWVFHISTLLNMQHISTERHAHWLTITSRSWLYYQAKGNINEGIMSHVSPAEMTCFLSYCNSIFHLYYLCYVTEWPSLTR